MDQDGEEIVEEILLEGQGKSHSKFKHNQDLQEKKYELRIPNKNEYHSIESDSK